MASLRRRSNGKYSLDFRWKGKPHIKALGTDDFQEAEQIRKDAEDQLARIRRGESALASRLLAEGFSILDVLFGSPEIASRLTETAEGNPLPLGELLNGYVTHLKATVGFDQHYNSEIWRKQLSGFFGDDRPVMSLTLDDLEAYRKHRVGADNKNLTTFKKEITTLKAAVRWGIERKLLSADPIGR